MIPQRLALGDANLQRHQIEPGDHLGHRVFNLQPGVHLEEIERAALLEQELHRAGTAVIDAARSLDRRRTHARTQLIVHHRTRRFLDHLLMTTLHRAVALAEVQGVAVAVGKHLEFDMARAHDGFFEDQFRGAEGVQRLGSRAAKRAGQRAAPRAPGACRGLRRRQLP